MTNVTEQSIPGSNVICHYHYYNNKLVTI